MGKRKGSRVERELFHLFHSTKTHTCARIAGSGSTPKPAPDLLVGGRGRVLAIECKSGKGKRRDIKKKQIEELQEFSKLFGAEPWIAARFDNMPWYFLKVKQLGVSKGNNYFINPKLAIKKGLRFEEIIGKYRQKKFG
ncbi:MAG: Holliday junction resolvase Hjc [Candidatus Woesearchaeota archaeon]